VSKLGLLALWLFSHIFSTDADSIRMHRSLCLPDGMASAVLRIEAKGLVLAYGALTIGNIVCCLRRQRYRLLCMTLLLVALVGPSLLFNWYRPYCVELASLHLHVNVLVLLVAQVHILVLLSQARAGQSTGKHGRIPAYVLKAAAVALAVIPSCNPGGFAFVNFSTLASVLLALEVCSGPKDELKQSHAKSN
jgi:hypothetical protein